MQTFAKISMMAAIVFTTTDAEPVLDTEVVENFDDFDEDYDDLEAREL